MVDPLNALEDHSYSLNVKYSLSFANLNDHNFFFANIHCISKGYFV